MYEIYQRLLDEKGLKNADVARATGISNMTLSDWKRGKSVPKSDKMQKIAEFLNVTEDYLRTGKEMEFTAGMAEIDLELSQMKERIKLYALKLSKLSKSDQDTIMSLIDRMNGEVENVWVRRKRKRKMVVVLVSYWQ